MIRLFCLLSRVLHHYRLFESVIQPAECPGVGIIQRRENVVLETGGEQWSKFARSDVANGKALRSFRRTTQLHSYMQKQVILSFRAAQGSAQRGIDLVYGY